MTNRIGPKERKRILELKTLGLTDKVIAIRLGISERTVRVYSRAARESQPPYHPTRKLDVDV